MPAPKAKPNPSGLGRAIINRRAKVHAAQVQEELHQTELPSGLKSVTQETNLDEFLNTAQLAETDFTAERNNSIRVIPQTTASYRNPYLLTSNEESQVAKKQAAHRKLLRVPRRPNWSRDIDKQELEKNERTSFLEWRRQLANLTEEQEFLLTPFERNLEVWRQLWRTIERSQLVVQIVDARNPLSFRCVDLDDYIHEMNSNPPDQDSEPIQRKTLLLVNKADLLTKNQRQAWADYFDSQNISFAFFSALDAVTLQEKLAKQDTLETDPIPLTSSDSSGPDDKTRILTVYELEELFMNAAPSLSSDVDEKGRESKWTIGLVGYPNVGKSSTINALIGAKKVSVSSTPGKTKNFQTIHLPESRIILCDCPGLVFPQFAKTKAEMILDGVLPIDQMREHTAPVDLLCQRIPKHVLEATYGLSITIQPIEEGGTGVPNAGELLAAYCVARGYFTQGQGNPDEPRGSRPILKDYVNGKLLFGQSPPGTDVDEFNAESRDLHRLILLEKVRAKRAPTTRVGKNADTFIPSGAAKDPSDQTPKPSFKSSALDQAFFADLQRTQGEAHVRAQSFPHQNVLGPDGRPLADANGFDPDLYSKKHNKGNKREWVRQDGQRIGAD